VGTIVGIAVGCLAGIAILIGLIVGIICLCKKRPAVHESNRRRHGIRTTMVTCFSTVSIGQFDELFQSTATSGLFNDSTNQNQCLASFAFHAIRACPSLYSVIMHKIPIKRIQLNLSQYALNLFQFSNIKSNKKYVRQSNDQISTSDTRNGNTIFTVSPFFPENTPEY
jgi:hypothetical protein